MCHEPNNVGYNCCFMKLRAFNRVRREKERVTVSVITQIPSLVLFIPLCKFQFPSRVRPADQIIALSYSRCRGGGHAGARRATWGSARSARSWARAFAAGPAGSGGRGREQAQDGQVRVDPDVSRSGLVRAATWQSEVTWPSGRGICKI